MRRSVIALMLFVCASATAAQKAKNVILFIADAGGVPTLHAASVRKYDQPQKLFVQSLPHMALMDTSAADAWVTDSAAGMSAIVTGQKTNNGVISQSAAAVRGRTDGEVLKTILEHAEERGLSTGVLTNMSVVDATPAACYAHSNDRGKAGEIFAQILKPRFGDGVDLVIGAGRRSILGATQKLGVEIEPALREKGYLFTESFSAAPAGQRRIVALTDNGDFELWPAVERAMDTLSKNPKGYFLMVEWDAHTNRLERGLDRVIELDDVVRRVSEKVKNDTLIIFAADHSFDLRVRGGRPGTPILPEPQVAGDAPQPKPRIRVEDSHTGEQVLAAAKGPGAERVRGFIANTDLFRIMMAAYGWDSKK